MNLIELVNRVLRHIAILIVLAFPGHASAQSLTCSFCPIPDTTWLTAVSHTNSANVVRGIGFSSLGLSGANALYLGFGTPGLGLDATKYVVLDASEQVSFRVGTVQFGSFWGGAHVPMFGLNVPRIQIVNTVTKNALWFFEGMTATDPVAHALVIRAQNASGVNSARSGALVLEAGLVSLTGTGIPIANDVRINAGSKGSAFWGNIVFDEYTAAADDTTDVPPVQANGMKGGLVMPPKATAAPTAPLPDRAVLYTDPDTGELEICQPTEATCRPL